MPKKPMVTRTITTTKATVMVANIQSSQISNQEVTLPRTYKDTDSVIKAARPVVESDPNLKVVAVVATCTEEQLYGMTEAEFLLHAKPLPPRGTGSSTEDETEDGDTTDAEHPA